MNKDTIASLVSAILLFICYVFAIRGLSAVTGIQYTTLATVIFGSHVVYQFYKIAKEN